MAQTADAIVIGAGVIGAAVAYELAKQGQTGSGPRCQRRGGARVHRRVLRDHPGALFHARRLRDGL
jgi:glycine/D-amino acid oxidase-like deaminating enzyme